MCSIENCTYQISKIESPVDKVWEVTLILDFAEGSVEECVSTHKSEVMATYLVLTAAVKFLQLIREAKESDPEPGKPIRDVDPFSDVDSAKGPAKMSDIALKNLIETQSLSKTANGLLMSLSNRKLIKYEKTYEETDVGTLYTVKVWFSNVKYIGRGEDADVPLALEKALINCFSQFYKKLLPILHIDKKPLETPLGVMGKGFGSFVPEKSKNPMIVGIDIESISRKVSDALEVHLLTILKKSFVGLTDRSHILREDAVQPFFRKCFDKLPDLKDEMGPFKFQTPDIVVVCKSAIVIIEVLWTGSVAAARDKIGKYRGLCLAFRELGYFAEDIYMIAPWDCSNSIELHTFMEESLPNEFSMAKNNKKFDKDFVWPRGWWSERWMISTCYNAAHYVAQDDPASLINLHDIAGSLTEELIKQDALMRTKNFFK